MVQEYIGLTPSHSMLAPFATLLQLGIGLELAVQRTHYRCKVRAGVNNPSHNALSGPITPQSLRITLVATAMDHKIIRLRADEITHDPCLGSTR